MYTFLIIDDDLTSGILLDDLMKNFTNYSCLGVYSDPVEGLQKVVELNPDFVILDIEMPILSGVDILKSLNNQTKSIVVSSNDKNAFKTHGLNVVEYLLKPIKLEHLSIAIDKLNLSSIGNKEDTGFFVKTNSGLVKIKYEELLFIESKGDFVKIQNLKGKVLSNVTLKRIQNFLPSNKFCRIHKSFIINIDSIDRIEENLVVINNKTIPVGRSYKSGLMKKLRLV